MSSLETRLPPPLVALLVALAMAATRLLPGRLPLDSSWRFGLAGLLVVVGLAFAVPAVLAFRRARTTIDPVHIEAASTLVTGGVFALSRNPMYVGSAIVLCAFVLLAGTPWAALGPPLFVAYVTRFQILPEERLLAARFGAPYDAWCRRVRRWL